MTRKKVTPTTTEHVSADAEAAMVDYIVETNAGHVTVPAEQVEGKTAEELNAYLDGNDYLSRIGAHRIVKVTRETLFSRTI